MTYVCKLKKSLSLLHETLTLLFLCMYVTFSCSCTFNLLNLFITLVLFQGTPKLRKFADCHYEFTWATNVICPPHMCDFDEKSCEIKNSELGVSYNLKKATFANEGKIKVSTHSCT